MWKPPETSQQQREVSTPRTEGMRKGETIVDPRGVLA